LPAATVVAEPDVPAIAAGGLAGVLISWPAGLIAAGPALCTGALFSYRASPAFSPTTRVPSARRRTRRRLRREANSQSGYLDEHQIAAICEIAAQVLPPAV
jgi:hypothetical protein